MSNSEIIWFLSDAKLRRTPPGGDLLDERCCTHRKEKSAAAADVAPVNARSNGGDSGAGAKSADDSAQLSALRAIVDDLDDGIVVLDQQRRARFINRAFRRFWRVPDELAESGPSFIKLMYHKRGMEAYPVSQERFGDYVAQQLTLIRTGEERPLNIELRNGKVLQFRCKALPDGGRLLTYGNVSELAREAEAIERLACTDAMTGLNNRRHFLVLAENEWHRFQRYRQPFAFLIIDIDLFKSVNDTYGHDVGDEVIKSVANILLKNKRWPDIAGRLGGEEFVLMLPETKLDGAVVAAERLRQMVADHVVSVGEDRIPVTISIGASSCEADADRLDEIIKHADVALYEAKRSGRNRVCRFDPGKAAASAAVSG
jgi:diguanylate cyclase (GGDEF)-like protein